MSADTSDHRTARPSSVPTVSPWARPLPSATGSRPVTGPHPITGPFSRRRTGPKPGVPDGAVVETVGTAGFTGPLAFTELDVAAAAGGDRTAFAAIYDRYSPRLYDFCVGMLRDRDAAADAVQDTFCTAATRLHQLREPDKLRPWLYAIARHESLRRIRSRHREEAVDEVPEQASGDAGPEALAARTELADLVADAAGGLSDRDRTVLEMQYRHGLDGPELADALGLSQTAVNTLVGRLRSTVERSLGALLVARHARANPGDCPELDAVLDGWDGRFTVLMRKRVARHLDHCPTCDGARREMVTPQALLASAPLAVPAPFWLRDHVLAHATPHLHHAGGAASGAAGGGSSWWPSAKADGMTRGVHGLHGLHTVHLAVAAPLLAVLVAAPVVAVAANAPASVATTAAPAAVAPPWRMPLVPSSQPPSQHPSPGQSQGQSQGPSASPAMPTNRAPAGGAPPASVAPQPGPAGPPAVTTEPAPSSGPPIDKRLFPTFPDGPPGSPGHRPGPTTRPSSGPTTVPSTTVPTATRPGS